VSPEEYIATLDEPRRSEIQGLHELIRSTIPEREPYMDRDMIGYGPYHYRYASGREGDTFLVGLASRKNYISLYVQCTDEGAYLAERFRERLPKAKIGKSCVTFKRPSDLDGEALRELIAEAGRIGPPCEA
jgi:hypothetical protein